MEIGFSRRCWLAGFACSVTALGLMSHYLRWTVRGMDRLVLLAGVIMLAATAALWFFWKEKREKRFAIGFGMLFALSQLCGERVLGTGTIAQTGVELLELLALALALAPCAGGRFLRACKRSWPGPEPCGPYAARTAWRENRFLGEHAGFAALLASLSAGVLSRIVHL
ncbi:MAG: hypothetical protein PUD63_08585 [Clostridia bacterium]|nr:hypothetical protein [Clostridia bacterium]